MRLLPVLVIAFIVLACGGAPATPVTTPTPGAATPVGPTPTMGHTALPATPPAATATLSTPSSPSPTPNGATAPSLDLLVAGLLPSLAGYQLEGDARFATRDEVIADLDRMIEGATGDNRARIEAERNRLLANGLVGRASLALESADGRTIDATIFAFESLDGARAEYEARATNFPCPPAELPDTTLDAAAFRCASPVGTVPIVLTSAGPYMLAASMAPLRPDADFAEEVAAVVALLQAMASRLGQP